MNEFIFHNVGQGLFYSGHLYKRTYNFVYDCGSVSSRKFLNDAIDNAFNDEVIDFIVISHLHADHINGINRLRKNKIKKYYLPYLGNGNDSLKKLLIAISSFEKGVTGAFSEETYKLFKKLYKLDDIDITNIEVEYIGKNAEISNKNTNTVYSKIEFRSSNNSGPIYEFIMFNKRMNDTLLKELNDEIYDLLLKKGHSNIDDLINSGLLNEVREIYEKVFKKTTDLLNLTSTILVHKPLDNLCLKIISKGSNKHRHINNCSKPITILTGDALFDSEMLKRLNQELLKEKEPLTIFQIPHHGSTRNWNSLTHTHKFIFDFYVIPFGLGNIYRHPNSVVINELSSVAIKNVVLVNQLYRFSYYIG